MILILFVVLMSVTLTILLLASRTPDPLSTRVHALQFRRNDDASDAQTMTRPDVLETQARTLNSLERLILQTSAGRRLQQLVQQAGLSLPLHKIVLWSLAGASTAAIATAMFFHAVFLHAVLFGSAVFAVTAGLPLIALRFLRSRRVKRFEAVLPDAIQLMARSLRAGHSVSAAIEMVGEQAAHPLADEFLQVSQQQRLGLMARDTLAQLANRVPSQDLRFLVTAIQVQRENGGDLTEVLDRTAHVISERLRIAGEVRIYSAQGRLTGWILSLLPLALLLLISIGNPLYARTFFTDPTGQRMLIGSAVSIAIGVFFIRRIVDIKV